MAQNGSVTIEAIEKAIESFIIEKKFFDKEDFIVEINRIPRQNIPGKGAIRLAVQPASSNTEMRGNTIFYISMYLHGKRIDRLSVVATIRKFEDVLVSKHRLNRHAVCSESDFIEARREITHLRATPVKSLAEVDGKRAVRIIAEGTIICQKDLQELPIVTRGEVISLLLRNKNLTIDLKGEALADGWKGDKIWVRLLKGQQKYLAEIQNSKLALIQY
jgi:flagella basal body P-ring formation protein FlgA